MRLYQGAIYTNKETDEKNILIRHGVDFVDYYSVREKVTYVMEREKFQSTHNRLNHLLKEGDKVKVISEETVLHRLNTPIKTNQGGLYLSYPAVWDCEMYKFCDKILTIQEVLKTTGGRYRVTNKFGESIHYFFDAEMLIPLGITVRRF